MLGRVQFCRLGRPSVLHGPRLVRLHPHVTGVRLQRGERGWTVPVPLHPDEASILS